MFELKSKSNNDKIKPKKTIFLFGDSVERDWIILISFLFFILIAGLIFSWFIFNSISSESVLTEEEFRQRSSLKIDTEQLDRVVSNLNKKKEIFESLTSVPVEESSADLGELPEELNFD